MATAKRILNDIKCGKLTTVNENIEELFDSGQFTDDKQSLVLQSTFIQHWLHALVTKLSTFKETGEIKEVVAVCLTCCEKYIHLLDKLAVDKTCAVSQMVYHVLAAMQNKAYVGDVLTMSELVYKIINKESLPVSDPSRKVVSMMYTYLWHLPGVLQKQGNTGVELIVQWQLQKLSLMFLCKIPDRHKLCDLLSRITTHFFQTHNDPSKGPVNSKTQDVFISIFDCITCHIETYSKSLTDVTEIKKTTGLLLQIQLILVESSLTLSNFETVTAVISKLDSAEMKHTLVTSLSEIFQVLLILYKLGNGTPDTAQCSSLLKTVHQRIESYMQGEVGYSEMKILFQALSLMLHSCGSKVQQKLRSESDVLQELSACCDVLQGIINTCLTFHTDKHKDNQVTDNSDESRKFYISKCKTLFRKLQFTFMITKSTKCDVDCAKLLEVFVNVAKESQNLLNKGSCMPEKFISIDRQNLGSMCTLMASYCLQKAHYSTVSTLSTIAIQQMIKCKKDSVEEYEMLIESYEKQAQWMDGTKAAIQALISNPTAIKPIVTAWARLKREAMIKEEIFKCLTMKSVVETSSKEIAGVTGRQLLIAEYDAWKHFTRRQHDVEHHILVEIAAIVQTDTQRAETLIDLVANTFITSLTYSDRSISDMLDEALKLLQKASTDDLSERLLAVACFFKYLVSHEQYAQRLRSGCDVDEDIGISLSGNIRDLNIICSLQLEQSYLSLLTSAVQHWENSVPVVTTQCDQSTPAPSPHTVSAADLDKSKPGSAISESEHRDTGCLIDVQQQVDIILHCSTRLVNMLQPELSVRALLVAKSLSSSMGRHRRHSEIVCQLGQALISVGRYQEAQLLVAEVGAKENDVHMSLLLAQLFMCTGKREEGMARLESVIENCSTRTVSSHLTTGTAKRLLSMLLCYPGQHTVHSSQHYLLSLAYEAVHSHLSVLNHVFKNKMDKVSKDNDIWHYQYELLQSLYHLCQLYRYVGIPRDAVSYLRVGLNLAQFQAVPAWCCKFLTEMLHLQAMEASFEKAVNTLDSIKQVFNLTTPSDTLANNTKHFLQPKQAEDSGKATIVKSSQIKDNSEVDSAVSNVCFGFESLVITPKGKTREAREDKTPERTCQVEELSSEKKKLLEHVLLPECTCVSNNLSVCPDIHQHQLCLSAAVAIAQFLLLAGVRSSACKVLRQIQANNHIFKTTSFLDPRQFFQRKPSERKQELLDSGLRNEPDTMLACLTASCVHAELCLGQKNYSDVHMTWRMVEEVREIGLCDNLVHQTLLLSRLALCQASTYLLSSTQTVNEKQTIIPTESVLDVSELLPSLAASMRKKVSFGENCPSTVKNTKSKVSKRGRTSTVKNEAEVMATPLKSSTKVGVGLVTPQYPYINQMFLSGKKSRVTSQLHTPATRILDLTTLMDSDEDDPLTFPDKKPITPSHCRSSKVKSRTSRTEPRPASRKTSKTFIKPSIACKMDFASEIYQDDSDEVKTRCASMDSIGELCEQAEALPQLPHNTPASVGDDIKTSDIVIKASIAPSQSKSRRGRGKSSKLKTMSSEVTDTVSVFDEGECKDDGVNILTEKLDNDIFDFGKESSPHVSKTTATSKSVQKKATAGKRKVATKPRTTRVQTLEELEDIKENVKVNETGDNIVLTKGVATKRKPGKKSTEEVHVGKADKSVEKPARRTRGKKILDEIETARTVHTAIAQTLDISVDDIEDCTSDNSICEVTSSRNSYTRFGARPHSTVVNDMLIDIPVGTITSSLASTSTDICESETRSNCGIDGVNELCDANLEEPIEIMRGDTRASKRTVKGKRQKKADMQVEGCVSAEGSASVDSQSHGTEKGQRRESVGGVEMMRSGRVSSNLAQDLAQHLYIESDNERPDVPTHGVESGDKEEMYERLLQLYHQLNMLPPSPQHADICNLLALHYLETQPQQAAFYLTDGLAITFRHQVMLNTAKKIRKQSLENRDLSSELSTQSQAMFSQETKHLNNMIAAIPKDWCVVQISVVKVGVTWKQMIITRFTQHSSPLLIKLPAFNTPQGCSILDDFSCIMEGVRDTSKIEQKAEWWKKRSKLNDDMQALLDRVEKYWLAEWKCLVMPADVSNKIVQQAQKDLNKALPSTVQTAVVQVLLLGMRCCSEDELRLCCQALLPTSHTDTIISILKKYGNCPSSSTQQHVVLILDKCVQHLPWESIPGLKEKSVTRMPCLAHVYTQLSYLHTQDSSVFNRGVNLKNTAYILNPGDDLPYTEKQFREWFEKEEGWTGVTGRQPSHQMFVDALTHKDFLIYCGHGTGGRYFDSDELEKLNSRAVPMLMGCSSGKLLVKGQLEPSGMMISYFLAGCPCMIGNLWDVTDKDIDKFTSEFLTACSAAKHGTFLPSLVQASRHVCKMKYINGCSVVVYGLPVFLNKT